MKKKLNFDVCSSVTQDNSTRGAEKGRMEPLKEQTYLDHSVYPHVYRSVLTFLPDKDLATVLRTSRKTGKDAGNLLYRTIYFDLGDNKRTPPRPSPLQPPTIVNPGTDRQNIWVSARVQAQRGLNAVPNIRLDSRVDGEGGNVLATPKLAFPGDLVSLLGSTRIFETGPHDSTACSAGAEKTAPVSDLRVWRFRPGHDRHELDPQRRDESNRCGTGRMRIIEGCANPTECSMAQYLSPVHLVVLLSKNYMICPINDPISFLTLPALGNMPSTVRKLTVALPANEVLPDREWSFRRSNRYETKIAITVQITHIELVLLADRSANFRSKFMEKCTPPDESWPRPLGTYLCRLRDTIVDRLCDTECQIRLIGFEFIEQSWLVNEETLAPALNWSYEEEIRSAVAVRQVAKRSTKEEQVRIRQARQGRLSVTDLQGYASSVEASDSLGEEEVGVLCRASNLRREAGD